MPFFLGEGLPAYEGYKSDTHPGITHVFQSAAFRFGHTLIPPGIYRRDGQCDFKHTPNGAPALRLCATWWNSDVSNLFSVIPIKHLKETKQFTQISVLCQKVHESLRSTDMINS